MSSSDELRELYIRSATEKLAMLEELWQQAVAGHLGEEAVAPLKQFSHRLAGSGGSYGFPAMGDAARELELLLADAGRLAASEAEAVRLYERLKSELSALGREASEPS